MSVKMVRDNGTAIFVCPQCSREFESQYSFSEDFFCADAIRQMYEKLLCPSCIAANEKAKETEMEQQFQAELLSSLDQRLAEAGVPKRFRNMDKPFVRHTAEWIYRNRDKSLLISGMTGTGKTSSACFVLRLLLRQSYISSRYCSRQGLFADYTRAKTTDGDNEYYFLSRLDKLDLLIIDEMVGKKGDARLSDSAQELFFNLIDGVYSQARDTRVWILGNFYRGAIDNLVDDPEPIKRRIKESFKVAWFDMEAVDDTLSLDAGNA